MNATLIVSIVRKGWGSTVLKAFAGAATRGGTVPMSRGIAFLLPVDKVVGVAHFLKRMQEREGND